MLNIEQRNRLCDLLYVLESSCRNYDAFAQSAPALLPPRAFVLHRDLAGRTAAQTRAILDRDIQLRGWKLQLRHVPQMPRQDGAAAVAPSDEERRRELERLHDAIRARRILHAAPKRRSEPKP